MDGLSRGVAHYHLPGLFEFYELYCAFLPLFFTHREYFYDWCDIGSIYGAPADCLWGGGRVGFGDNDPREVAALMGKYGISARLTFSNSLLGEEHLGDKQCNRLCALFNGSGRVQNGVIVHSDLLLDYLKQAYPNLYFVSSTTKVLTDFSRFQEETEREDFRYVVPDFRLNKQFDKLKPYRSPKKIRWSFSATSVAGSAAPTGRPAMKTSAAKISGNTAPTIAAPPPMQKAAIASPKP